VKDSFYKKGLLGQLQSSQRINDQRRFKLALKHISNAQLIAQYNNEQDPWAKEEIRKESARRLKRRDK
jgi:hypothetical protein